MAGAELGSLHGGEPDDTLYEEGDHLRTPYRFTRKHTVGILGGAALAVGINLISLPYILLLNAIGYVGARAAASYNRWHIQNTQPEPSQIEHKP